MNKIFSSNDSDVIERLREKNQRDIKMSGDKITIDTAARTRPAAESLSSAAGDITAAGQRLLLRTERTLQGLIAAKALFERPESADEKGALLNTLIEQTRFQDEPVLKDYAQTLKHAVRDQDPAALDYLVINFQNKLAASAKDQVIRENLSAVSSLIPENLLKDVVRALKSEGLPQVTIARQRVLDLLRPV